MVRKINKWLFALLGYLISGIIIILIGTLFGSSSEGIGKFIGLVFWFWLVWAISKHFEEKNKNKPKKTKENKLDPIKILKVGGIILIILLAILFLTSLFQ